MQRPLVARKAPARVVVHAGQAWTRRKAETLGSSRVDEVSLWVGCRRGVRKYPQPHIDRSPTVVARALSADVQAFHRAVEPAHSDAGPGKDPVGFALCRPKEVVRDWRVVVDEDCDCGSGLRPDR